MDDPISWLYLVLIILLVALLAFFSSLETALSCLNQFKMRAEADAGSKSAKLVVKVYRSFDKSLVAALVGSNVASLAASALATLLFVLLFKSLAVTDEAVSLISTAVMTVLVYIFGDTIPKLIARARPEKVALANVRVFIFFYWILYPLVFVFSGVTTLIAKAARVKERPTLTEEDFENVVGELNEKAEGEGDAALIQHSLEFSDTSVRDVLTPRDKMFYIDLLSTPKRKINEIVLSTEYSRIPVCYGSIDRIVGILHVKNYIMAYLKDPGLNILASLQKPYFVTPRIKIDDMIEGFRKHRTHIAVVKSGDKVVGMLTMEDVLEELVGKMEESPSEKERRRRR